MLLLLHHFQCCLHDEEHAFEIDVVCGVPVGFGHGIQWRVRKNAGVGAQNVQPSISLHRRIYRREATGLRAHIQFHKVCAQFAGRLFAG